MLIADTHVHIFTDDRKKYPQIRDTARAGSIPTITKLVEVFGAKRIMWSSNYPAHPRFGNIKSRLEESRKALAHLSADEQAWIFGKTAAGFYPALQSMA
jgi:predicted TIM-barrel fold metal-dependent hydrolase